MVNESVVISVGEPVRVGYGIQITINCSKLINRTINDGVTNFTVTWSKHGVVLLNGSLPNVIISADKLCIITETLLILSQYEFDELYTCEVCKNVTDCESVITEVIVCGKTCC